MIGCQECDPGDDDGCGQRRCLNDPTIVPPDTRCVDCLTTDDCPLGLHCDRWDDWECKECLENSHCPSDEVCFAPEHYCGKCDPMNDYCTPGTVCHPDKRECVICDTDARCNFDVQYPRCLLGPDVCVECLNSAEDCDKG